MKLFSDNNGLQFQEDKMSLSFRKVECQIHLVTGLHIGAGNAEIHIGGIDNPVIKGEDNFPYIPGSSLKGKMRCLLEKAACTSDSERQLINRMFGQPVSTDRENREKNEWTRLLFRDCFLDKDSRHELLEKSIPPTEAKWENTIDRRTCIANPRNIERIIPGLDFKCEIIVRLLDDDDEKAFKDELIKGMKLLQFDALGGNGSRGYGKVEFSHVNWNGEEITI